MDAERLTGMVVGSLEDLKGVDIAVLDVRALTSVTDVMVIATGNSDRQVRALADRVLEDARKAGVRPAGVEGEKQADWILIDLLDVVIHIMRPETRDFYQLEKLWSPDAGAGGAGGA